MNSPTEKQVRILEERRIASVATIGENGLPHLTAVWFLYEDDCLYLAIPSSSAKGKNLARNPAIAVMIDVRVDGKEAGITLIGEADFITGDEAVAINDRVHRKYITDVGLADPQIAAFFAADDVAVRTRPGRWISWDMSQVDAEFFNGALASSAYFKDIVP